MTSLAAAMGMEREGTLAALANPMMMRQFAKQRETARIPASVTDPRWNDYKKNLTQAQTALMVADLLPALSIAKPGLMALGRLAGPATENYMARTGLLQSVTAYHGSPHSFSKFDLGKIGTGEGAQAYGKGLYFAENPGVAKGYQAKLSGPEGGSLYRVEIPDEAVGKMLDWDKPLGQQPKTVQMALRTYIGPERFLLNKERKAGEYFRAMEGRSSPEVVAQALRENGIPGIRYLDQGSRASGTGTSNFVVFDDRLVSIKESK